MEKQKKSELQGGYCCLLVLVIIDPIMSSLSIVLYNPTMLDIHDQLINICSIINTYQELTTIVLQTILLHLRADLLILDSRCPKMTLQVSQNDTPPRVSGLSLIFIESGLELPQFVTLASLCLMMLRFTLFGLK